MSTLKKMRLHSIVAVALAVVLLTASSVVACGPFLIEAVFIHTVHPDYPLQRFASGRLGVVQPSYARSYLYVAYRNLQDAPFTAEEQKALAEFWKERLEPDSSLGDEDWVKSWIDARRKVTTTEPPSINAYKRREKPNEYESYLNCQKDSFDTAIATLDQRITKYGAGSAPVKTWVEAQDQVFSVCGGGSSIPAALGADADVLMRADRAYQTAAANFYAGNFDEARKGFAAIAADSNSPWQQGAVYLIARVLARKASLGPAEQKTESLTEAEAQLREILADKKLSALHPASVRLLNLVRLRAHPAERMHELAQTLSRKAPNPNLKQDLWDYTALFDAYWEGDEPKKQELPRTDDLTDWLATMQTQSTAATEHAYSRWQATYANTWLIAALSSAGGKNAQAGELISAGLSVKNNSPAFAAARFNAMRLLMESGRDAEAVNVVEKMLKSDRGQFNQSTLNLLTDHRMMLATNLADFLADAAHVPASLSWNDDGREIPAADADLANETKALNGKAFFDETAANVLNKITPISVLKEAAKSDVLPQHLRRDLAQATWLRAVMLGDTKTADELAPVLSNLLSEAAPLLSSYLASQPDEKKFAAIYAWLKFPGLEPQIDLGIGRQWPLDKQDSLRDNWWCAATYHELTGEDDRDSGYLSFTGTKDERPRFLTAAQIKKGESEWAALGALGAGPNYISKTVIDWANRNPEDPRVPEGLHLAVKTTRYGCGDESTARWSKAAFDLLHRKYANSPWAKKTPYWFKG